MLQAIVLIGLPGSGKTTWRNNFLKYQCDSSEWVVASSDDIIDRYAAKHNINYSQAFHQIDLKATTQQFFEIIKSAIAQHKNILIDRTNMSQKSRRQVLSLLPKTYQKVAVNFSIDDITLNSRLKHRELETGKSIPVMVVRDMQRNYQQPTLVEFDKIIDVKN